MSNPFKSFQLCSGFFPYLTSQVWECTNDPVPKSRTKILLNGTVIPSYPPTFVVLFLMDRKRDNSFVVRAVETLKLTFRHNCLFMHFSNVFRNNHNNKENSSNRFFENNKFPHYTFPAGNISVYYILICNLLEGLSVKTLFYFAKKYT